MSELPHQDFARIYSHIAFLPVEDVGIYLLNQDENGLISTRWRGKEKGVEDVVTSDVQESTPAVYLADGTERRIFSINKHGQLQCHRHSISDAPGQKWRPLDLEYSADLVVHPKSCLSGCSYGDQSVLFFQDPYNQLRIYLCQWNGAYDERPSPDISMPIGAAHCAIRTQIFVKLFYIHADNNIHCLGLDLESDDCKDIVLQGTAFGSEHITKLLAIPTEDRDNLGILAFSSRGEVTLVSLSDGMRKLDIVE